MIRLFRRKQKTTTSPDPRVQRVEAQRREIEAERPHVESLVSRLRSHLDENHIGERLYEQIRLSRRET